MSVEIQQSEALQSKSGESFSFEAFFAPMKALQSADALNLWHEKVYKISTLLMDEARASSDNPELYEQLHEASRTLVDECNRIYDERIKELPKTVEITKNVLWSGGRLGLAGWSVITLFSAPIPGVNLVVGVAALGYAALEFFGKTKKVIADQKSEKSLVDKAESGIKLVNASAEVSLGVIGLIALTGVFAPYVALPLAIAALAPIVVDAAFQAKDFYTMRKEVKKTQKDSISQLSQLDGVVDHLKKSTIDHSFVDHLLHHAQKLFWDQFEQDRYKRPYEFSHHKKHQDAALSPELSEDKTAKFVPDIAKVSMRF